MSTDTLLSTVAAADRLGLTRKTLEHWRITGQGPVFVKLGRAVRYEAAALDEFVSQCRRKHTAEFTK